MKTLLDIQANLPEVKRKELLQLITFIDLTTLNATDTEKEISKIVTSANLGFEGHHPAAVCSFPNFANEIKTQLIPTISCAVVGGCFPTGQTISSSKIEEVSQIARTNCDEIDIVINRGDFLAGKTALVQQEISALKNAAKSKKLKVILETGDLKSSKSIALASDLAIAAHADFIKTSTGKTTVGATPEAVHTMCLSIKKHYDKTGKKVGLKPSGGIRTVADAFLYYTIVKETLGKEWLTPQLFRIGASSLFENIKKAYH